MSWSTLENNKNGLKIVLHIMHLPICVVVVVVLLLFNVHGKHLRSSYGENLIAPCSQVHDNFTMGVNRKILINLIYLFIQETYLTCANGL